MLDMFITGDCEEVMAKMPENSVDLIVTSPPYADQRLYGTANSSARPNDFIDWLWPKTLQMKRVLKEDGSLILNINDKVVDNFQHLYVYELIIKLCKEGGFKLVRDYIWHNPSSPPNIYSSGNHGRTKKSHEYCFWLVKGDSWYFNIDPIRKPYSADMERLLAGKGKGDRSENERPSTHSFDCQKVWTDNGGSDPGSVIEIGNTASNDRFSVLCREKNIEHPARFPEKLAEFFILAGSEPEDLVLDPFSGSGTTAVSACKNGRHWIGIEANVSYNELANERMIEATRQPNLINL